MINTAPGAAFEATVTAASGLAGTLGARIRTSAGGDYLARTTLGVTADTTVGTTSVYRRAFIAPSVSGRYSLIWDDGVGIVDTEELVVSYTRPAPDAPSGRDLCTVSFVLGYIPGYRQSDTVEQKLQELITAESQLIHDDTGREIVAFGEQPQDRVFDIGHAAEVTRALDIGDLSTPDGITVELDSAAGTTIATIDADAYVPIYRHTRVRRQEWEPVTALEFPRGATGAPSFGRGQTIKITGTWGFPEIPAFIRDACAKRVLLRYVSDVGGSDITVGAADLNLAAMFASARDSVDALKTHVFIA